MTRQEFLKSLQENYENCVEISKRKNSDYANSDDPFQNFKLIEYLTNDKITTEMGILVRLSDKFQRMGNLLFKEADVKDESINDTIDDLCNYAQILKLYRQEKSIGRTKSK